MSAYPWLEEYLLQRPGVTSDFKVEWGWQRYMVGGKLCAAFIHPTYKSSAAFADKDLLTLKFDPLLPPLRPQPHPEVLPGFYSDKRCWNSVDLGGGLPDDLLRQMIDDSYQLVFAKLTKKSQREIAAAPEK